MKVDCLGVVAGGFIGIYWEVKRAAFSKGLGVEARERGKRRINPVYLVHRRDGGGISEVRNRRAGIDLEERDPILDLWRDTM